MKPLQTLRYTLLVTICFACEITYSCEFHDGFGGASWPRYGLSPHPQSALGFDEGPRLTLGLPSMLSATQNRKTELPVTYGYKTEKDSVEIEISLDVDPAVMITEDKVAVLNEKNGKHVFSFLPISTGTYRLVVKARDINQPENPERSRVVYVSIKE